MKGHTVGWVFVDDLPRSISLAVHAIFCSIPLFYMWNAWIQFADDEDRLYSKGRVLGHKRAKRNSSPNTSLLQIEGVGSKEEAQFYLGKVRHSTAPPDPRVLISLSL